MAEDEGLEGVSTDAEDHFGSAADFLATAVISKDARFDDKLKLKFYGLYKQATAGKCTSGRPGFWDLAGRAKWDAWAELGDLSKTDAMQQYTELLSRVTSEWDGAGASGGPGGSAPPRSRGPMGPVFSCLAAEPDARDDEAGPRTLHEVAGEGDVDALTEMLEAGAAVDGKDDMGCTALHFAADRGSAGAAQALISAGADVNALDDEGQTPLHYAAVTQHREVYDFLVSCKADVSIRDAQGETAMEAAPASWGLT
ncbi:Acyl-CoA-binding domain-containing protein 1 [Tetrabaena socialis]|uniref:Acyl-CoA-binding domain-containing protein 1 n=1 Tax=Tetrabaena socialis TaxID=47790 RepID=A0A2J8A806_9CHLO|nr:Acyl-CoA-binding domain-containing protein 1 [Tetrabaena socialis]|eukprot:PNH08672.1 Acyl-CoA-binding domain-containing protein 1 [Tetrabaena socialis]